MKPQIIFSILAVLMTGCGKPGPPDVSIHEAAMEGDMEAIKQHLAAGTDPNLANLGERFLGDFIKPPLHFSKNKEVAELLIAGGADVNFKDQTGWAILHYWSFFPYGQLELIELLVANGADVNAKDRLGNTPLDKAIEGGYGWISYKVREERANIAEFLRKHGGKSGAPKSIVAAVNTANVEAVKKHLSSAGEESKKIKDVFFTAVRMDHREIVGLLLSSGTDLKAKLDDSLHEAKSVEVAKLLIENGANVNNAKGMFGGTPLHSIISLRTRMPTSDKNQNSSIQIVEMLIARGADVNASNDRGQTPLDLVGGIGMGVGIPAGGLPTPVGIELGNPAGSAPSGLIADLLLKRGGRTSRGLQASAESIEGATCEGDIEAVKKHLAKGADVNAKDGDGYTPLHSAVYYGHKEIAELLIAEGADVNAKGGGEWTPLHNAALGGHKEIVELLIANGVDVNAKDKDGLTPLIQSAIEGQKEVAELLISKGADVNARNKKGGTALGWAYAGNHTGTADLLRKHGGKTGEELEAVKK